ncbi:uncharacterized protein LOC107046133 [Diachasma alloeum]|uniref:uncharacterized protein LOC107046133 n=1 Tax=Diachasma alloeum TaxID=454923 RepID=UPI0007381C69|nr:uncharacterized protein LOC107046133 [Diachasma alloeum]
MTLPPFFTCGFLSYVRDHTVRDVQVYWYHPDFSQSRYPPGQQVSEACTLICLLVAQRICESKLQLENVETSPQLTAMIGASIVEGNDTHAWILRRGLVPHPYLNTDEALTFGGKRLKSIVEWQFQVFRENIETSLCTNIQRFLHDWYQKPRGETLIMLLITCGRTVLLLFQSRANKITLFDSHGHSTVRNPHRGLVVAQAKFERLYDLCDWYIQDVLHNCFNVYADQYELAFLYYVDAGCCKSEESPCDCGCNNC